MREEVPGGEMGGGGAASDATGIDIGLGGVWWPGVTQAALVGG